uniref:Uncharacterized protein n=1 Tax=Glossina pallidipes TaxID=7398 RepID=A0A1A9ZTP9_GLOPL
MEQNFLNSHKISSLHPYGVRNRVPMSGKYVRVMHKMHKMAKTIWKSAELMALSVVQIKRNCTHKRCCNIAIEIRNHNGTTKDVNLTIKHIMNLSSGSGLLYKTKNTHSINYYTTISSDIGTLRLKLYRKYSYKSLVTASRHLHTLHGELGERATVLERGTRIRQCSSYLALQHVIRSFSTIIAYLPLFYVGVYHNFRRSCRRYLKLNYKKGYNAEIAKQTSQHSVMLFRKFEWPGTSTKRGDRHDIVSSGAGDSINDTNIYRGHMRIMLIYTRQDIKRQHNEYMRCTPVQECKRNE